MRTFYDKFIKYNIPFQILTLISIALIITAFFIPPMAVIDSSVLYAVGELFGFAALWTLIVAIEKGSTAKIKHHDTELEIKHDKKDENFKIKIDED